MQAQTLFRVLVVALIAGVLQMTGLSPSAVAAPLAPTGLTPSGTSSQGQPVLSWNPVSEAARYEMQLSTDSNFSSVNYSVYTTNRRATPTTNLPQAELHWRVRGLTAGGQPGPWASASFENSVIAGPTPVAPLSNELLSQPDEPALLRWNPVPKATGYTIEIDDDNTFVGAVTKTSKTAAYLFTTFSPDLPYFWRVKADFAGGFNTQWSEVGSFTAKGLSAPELTAPASETRVTDAVLDWSPVPGAVTYEIRVSTDDQFNTIVDSATVYSTQYARPSTLNNDQYWWQVRSVDINGLKSDWASYFQFQRNWPEFPELIHPSAGAIVGDPFLFEWSPVPHASRYELQVSPDGTFSPGHYDTCMTKQTTLTTEVHAYGGECHPVAGRTSHWRVRGIDDSQSLKSINDLTLVKGIWSDIHSFTYDPTMVQQTGPPDNISPIDVPTLSWESYPEAEKYEVVITKANGSRISNTTYSTSWTLTGGTRLKASDGPFSWTVQALGKDGPLTQIPQSGSRFQVSGDVADTGLAALTPTSPISGAHSSRFPSLSWEPYFDDIGPATTYKVWISQNGSGRFLLDTFPYAAATDDSVEYLRPGTYNWSVAAYRNGVQLGGFGSPETFVIDPLGDVTGQALSLTGQGLLDANTRCDDYLDNPMAAEQLCGHTQQTPVLKWDGVASAAYYMIYVSRDRELTNLIYDPVRDLRARTSNTVWTPVDQLPDSQAGTAYYWVIRPCKSSGICAPDPTEATNAFDKRSNPISGLLEREHDRPDTLAGDPSEFSDEVVLSWEDYLLTNQAGNYLVGNDTGALASTVEAKTYRVQISTDKNFPQTAATFTSPEIDQMTYSVWSKTLPEGHLFWRVQAIDGSGNGLAWSLSRDLNSNARSIDKVAPPLVLTLPADNASASGTPTFQWRAQAYAAKYQIEVYKNTDTTFAAANRVVSATTVQPSYAVFDKVLAPSTAPYVWRVRRIDASGLYGPWTPGNSEGEASRRFTITGSPPTLTSPGAGTYVSNRYPYFTWNAVDNASTYKFEIRKVGSTSASSVTTVGLQWAPTAILSDTGYEWRVSASDSGNNPIGTAEWRTFIVDSVVPTVVSKTPTTTAPVSANFVATFSEPMVNVRTNTMGLFVKGQPAQLAATVTMSLGGTRATLNPALNLKPGTVYILRLRPGITDRARLALPAQSWTVTAR